MWVYEEKIEDLLFISYQASKNQSIKCMMLLCSKGASSSGNSFVCGAEKLRDYSSDRMDKQSSCIIQNETGFRLSIECRQASSYILQSLKRKADCLTQWGGN